MDIITALLIRPGLARDVTAFTATATDSHQTPREVLRALEASTARSRIVRAGAAAVTVWTSADRHADNRLNPWSSMVLADALNLVADLTPDDIMATPALTCRGLVVVTGRCLMTGALRTVRPAPDPLADAA